MPVSRTSIFRLILVKCVKTKVNLSGVVIFTAFQVVGQHGPVGQDQPGNHITCKHPQQKKGFGNYHSTIYQINVIQKDTSLEFSEMFSFWSVMLVVLLEGTTKQDSNSGICHEETLFCWFRHCHPQIKWCLLGMHQIEQQTTSKLQINKTIQNPFHTGKSARTVLFPPDFRNFLEFHPRSIAKSMVHACLRLFIIHVYIYIFIYTYIYIYHIYFHFYVSASSSCACSGGSV